MNENRFWQPPLKKIIQFLLFLTNFRFLRRLNYVFFQSVVLIVDQLQFKFRQSLEIRLKRVKIVRQFELGIRENRDIDVSVTGKHESIGIGNVKCRDHVENRRMRVL